VYTRLLTAGADTADTQRVTEAAPDISGTAAVDFAADAFDAGAAGWRKSATLVALIGTSSGHQALVTRMRRWM
jgi:hypothetical protein